jgi:hypothetical protein
MFSPAFFLGCLVTAFIMPLIITLNSPYLVSVVAIFMISLLLAFILYFAMVVYRRYRR